jgi:hypothetical protein
MRWVDRPLVDTRSGPSDAESRAVLSIRSSTERLLALDASGRIDSTRLPHPPSMTDPQRCRRCELHCRARGAATTLREKHFSGSSVFGENSAVDTRHGSPSATTALPAVMVRDH